MKWIAIVVISAALAAFLWNIRERALEMQKFRDECIQSEGFMYENDMAYFCIKSETIKMYRFK